MAKRHLLALSFIGAITLATSQADIIPQFISDPPSGVDFRWNYSSTVTAGQQVNAGNFFTIYDFHGFVPGSNLQPANWTFSASLTGLTPPRVSVSDDPTVFNLTWKYVGTTPLVGDLSLGSFSALSNTNLLGRDDFAAEATRSTNPNAGTLIENVGTISVPVPEMSALLPILAICGLGAFGLMRSITRRRPSAA
jgi:hypothetical protein